MYSVGRIFSQIR